MSGAYWDSIYAKLKPEDVKYDLWLQRYADRLRATASDSRPIVDLGCGAGNNTLYLTELGLPVIACDMSVEALKQVNARMPHVRTVRLNLLDPLPFADCCASAVIADLCLHYFRWTDTMVMMKELHRVLPAGGLLALRVNSVHDKAYGAGEGLELEPQLYERDGMMKRFFDQRQLEALLADGWRVLTMEEQQLDRYGKPKQVWFAAAERV
ncbi:class I SAM-dependent methyltransferase [Paenibacillus sp. YYML68]|uniref:class I SAM-dependent methyltransferase n=1 Tax=Paenibacillus sp. YYML68 TaxID=2909250 RepID=UPI0024906CA2|nr:class I SAM-dependent methyltransferase [Paenibacillus sp. YYML68]